MKKLILALLVVVGLYGGDANFSGTAPERHEEMSKNLNPKVPELSW